MLLNVPMITKENSHTKCNFEQRIFEQLTGINGCNNGHQEMTLANKHVLLKGEIKL